MKNIKEQFHNSSIPHYIEIHVNLNILEPLQHPGTRTKYQIRSNFPESKSSNLNLMTRKKI